MRDHQADVKRPPRLEAVLKLLATIFDFDVRNQRHRSTTLLVRMYRRLYIATRAAYQCAGVAASRPSAL
jgi:hypothetical protein